MRKLINNFFWYTGLKSYRFNKLTLQLKMAKLELKKKRIENKMSLEIIGARIDLLTIKLGL